jgi:hypothetical protein
LSWHVPIRGDEDVVPRLLCLADQLAVRKACIASRLGSGDSMVSEQIGNADGKHLVE